MNWVDPWGLASFGQNYSNSVRITRQAIYGNRINSVIGLATAGQVSSNLGSKTGLQLLFHVAETGTLQTSTLNAAGALTSTGVTMLTNALLVAGSLEVGIRIGSLINATFETLFKPDDCATN